MNVDVCNSVMDGRLLHVDQICRFSGIRSFEHCKPAEPVNRAATDPIQLTIIQLSESYATSGSDRPVMHAYIRGNQS